MTARIQGWPVLCLIVWCVSSCHTCMVASDYGHTLMSDVSHAGGLRLWTHFDVMSNLLCQIRGTKHIRLWPPSQVRNFQRVT